MVRGEVEMAPLLVFGKIKGRVETLVTHPADQATRLGLQILFFLDPVRLISEVQPETFSHPIEGSTIDP